MIELLVGNSGKTTLVSKFHGELRDLFGIQNEMIDLPFSYLDFSLDTSSTRYISYAIRSVRCFDDQLRLPDTSMLTSMANISLRTYFVVECYTL